MATYFKEVDRESLPAIRTSSGLLDSSSSARRVTFDEGRRSPAYVHAAESAAFQPRPPSPAGGRRQMQEVQDQMKVFREELQKKDALIQQLVSMDSIPKVNVRSQADSVRLESLYLGDRQSLDAARGELAAVQVKCEKLLVKNKELENEIEMRDVKIKEMQLMTETSRENEVRLQNIVESLRNQLADLEGRAGAFESVASRSEFTVTALQKESKEAQERIVDLESRQRKHLEEREEALARLDSLDRKHKELLSQIGSMLNIETLSGSGIPSVEEITVRLTEWSQENAMLKGKILTLTETMNNTELETKASRETIMRLVSEVGREKKDYERNVMEMDALRSERDVERSARHELEREIEILKERLQGSQRAMDAIRSELSMRDSRISELERDIRTNVHNVHTHSTQLTMFREQLANLLSDYDGSYGSEDDIRRKIENIVLMNRDFRGKTEALEDRVRTLTEQLEAQYELHKNAAHRARVAETDAHEYKERLRSIEGEVVAGDVLRDGFKSDKEKYLMCLQHLGEAMRMDRISLDLGFDMTIDALIARAQQLVKLERDALADRSTQVYNLQRKVKSHKEQLESKDLHIDLLRKKITSLEEKLLGKSTIERERDGETLKIRKLEKITEKYKIKLEDARQEITNLKAQLLGSSEIRVRTLEQRKEIEELMGQVNELEQLRKKQARKIHDLKSTVDSTQHSSQEDKVVADNAVQALSSELRTTKAALMGIQNREKALIDFRLVVARMLGLDMNTLAVPDYEIISRLEKLINAHHSHAFTTMSLEDALQDVEEGFMRGYEEYTNTIGAAESQNIRRSRERVKRKAMKARARSMSPVRRLNPKVY